MIFAKFKIKCAGVEIVSLCDDNSYFYCYLTFFSEITIFPLGKKCVTEVEAWLETKIIPTNVPCDCVKRKNKHCHIVYNSMAIRIMYIFI